MSRRELTLLPSLPQERAVTSLLSDSRLSFHGVLSSGGSAVCGPQKLIAFTQNVFDVCVECAQLLFLQLNGLP